MCRSGFSWWNHVMKRLACFHCAISLHNLAELASFLVTPEPSCGILRIIVRHMLRSENISTHNRRNWNVCLFIQTQQMVGWIRHTDSNCWDDWRDRLFKLSLIKPPWKGSLIKSVIKCDAEESLIRYWLINCLWYQFWLSVGTINSDTSSRVSSKHMHGLLLPVQNEVSFKEVYDVFRKHSSCVCCVPGTHSSSCTSNIQKRDGVRKF